MRVASTGLNLGLRGLCGAEPYCLSVTREIYSRLLSTCSILLGGVCVEDGEVQRTDVCTSNIANTGSSRPNDLWNHAVDGLSQVSLVF